MSEHSEHVQSKVRYYLEDADLDLPRNWRRRSTAELIRMRDEYQLLVENLDDEKDSVAIDDCDYAIDKIGEELDLRRSEAYIQQEPVDTDAQDRRAASEERIENHRRER